MLLMSLLNVKRSKCRKTLSSFEPHQLKVDGEVELEVVHQAGG